MTGDIPHSKAETMRRLKVGRIRYKQYIESGILPKPFAIVEGARPVHTESQILIAEQNLYRKAVRDLQPSNAPKMKPLSAKFISEITR